jgi:undecaprenyl-diphosphatase
MQLAYAAILGVLEGLTEFLPISSTAHLLIAERLLGFQDPDGTFTVMIQLGAIFAVVWLYRVRIFEVVTHLFTRPDARHFALAVIIAFVPAVIAGLAFAHFVKANLYSNLNVVAWAFIVGGVVFLIIERWRPTPKVEDAYNTPLPSALGIGVFQTLALIPGVSRSGATILGGLLLRLDRRAAAEFSFFLAMPTMLAAFLHDFWEIKDHLRESHTVEIAIGFVFAFLAALVVVKPFLNFISRAGFAPFAWYRIAAGGALLAAAMLHYL